MKKVVPYFIAALVSAVIVFLLMNKPVPTPDIIYVQNDSIVVLQRQVDSLMNVIDKRDIRIGDLKNRLLEKDHELDEQQARFDTMPPLEQVEYFAHRTDCDIQMLAADSMVLVPVPAIKIANRLIIERDNSKDKVLLLTTLVGVQDSTIHDYKLSKAKTDLQVEQYENDRIRDSRIIAEKDKTLINQGKRTKIISYIAGGTTVLALLVLLIK